MTSAASALGTETDDNIRRAPRQSRMRVGHFILPTLEKYLTALDSHVPGSYSLGRVTPCLERSTHDLQRIAFG